MIDPCLAMEAIRSELRSRVLPELEDPYARSVVIAALGILGNLALQVESDERWCEHSVTELIAGCTRWSRDEVAGPAGPPLAVAVERAMSERSPWHRRAVLLGAVEMLLGELWARPRDAAGDEILAEVRQVLVRDLARELERTR